MSRPTRTLGILIVAALLLPMTFAAVARDSATLESAQTAFNEGKLAQAAKQWHALATQGNPQAQVLYGLAHANGWGIAKNPSVASAWYRKAAEQGDPSGQFLLGMSLISNRGAADPDAGIVWLRKAAENGENEARRFLDKAQSRGWFGLGGDKARARAANDAQTKDNITAALHNDNDSDLLF